MRSSNRVDPVYCPLDELLIRTPAHLHCPSRWSWEARRGTDTHTQTHTLTHSLAYSSSHALLHPLDGWSHACGASDHRLAHVDMAALVPSAWPSATQHPGHHVLTEASCAADSVRSACSHSRRTPRADQTGRDDKTDDSKSDVRPETHRRPGAQLSSLHRVHSANEGSAFVVEMRADDERGVKDEKEMMRTWLSINHTLRSARCGNVRHRT